MASSYSRFQTAIQQEIAREFEEVSEQAYAKVLVHLALEVPGEKMSDEQEAAMKAGIAQGVSTLFNWMNDRGLVNENALTRYCLLQIVDRYRNGIAE